MLHWWIDYKQQIPKNYKSVLGKCILLLIDHYLENQVLEMHISLMEWPVSNDNSWDLESPKDKIWRVSLRAFLKGFNWCVKNHSGLEWHHFMGSDAGMNEKAGRHQKSSVCFLNWHNTTAVHALATTGRCDRWCSEDPKLAWALPPSTWFLSIILPE